MALTIPNVTFTKDGIQFSGSPSAEPVPAAAAVDKGVAGITIARHVVSLAVVFFTFWTGYWSGRAIGLVDKSADGQKCVQKGWTWFSAAALSYFILARMN
eukprot:TRINITY_DN2466_c2_g1_i2.p2 TRINITY_DN2466_c2_g1~~TRINITY_DN2466_c2_g1_i2.p2  ORF type:complete len:100 (+),score=29.19 TRINITY_DN2466_c2_g1_i2:278-577(+)